MIAGSHLPTLTAGRVTLRWLVPSDVDALYEVFSNADVMRYWARPPFTDVSEARDLLAVIERSFAEKSRFQWGIVRPEDDRVIGTCTLSSVNAANLRAELGYALLPAHWGQGLMRAALERLLDFAFRELGMRRLEADVDPNNARSMATVERLGFQREGYLRERWFVGGEPQDTVFYGLLRREWEARGGVQPASASGSHSAG
jgi:RimJ/RimL family protein N-acetyltransferase